MQRVIVTIIALVMNHTNALLLSKASGYTSNNFTNLTKNSLSGRRTGAVVEMRNQQQYIEEEEKSGVQHNYTGQY